MTPQGERAILFRVHPRERAGDVPLHPQLLRKLAGMRPTARPSIPEVDALSSSELDLHYNVFRNTLDVRIRFMVDEQPSWKDTSLEDAVHAALTRAWPSLEWTSPPDVPPLRLELTNELGRSFKPARVLAKSKPPFVGRRSSPAPWK